MAYFNLLILALAHLVVDMYTGFLMPLLPALEVSFDVSFAALAGVVGFSGIIVNLVQPLAARVSRYFPSHLFLFIGPAFSGTLALMGIIDSYEVFILISIISVISTGIFHPEGLIAAHVASGKHEHVGVPFFLSGGFFGFSTGAFISSQWYTNFGFSGFWLLAIPGVFFAVVLIMIRNDISPERHSESARMRNEIRAMANKKSFHISLLVLLGFFLVTPVAVTYTLYSKNLEMLFGEKIAIEWSGIVLALLGLFGAGGSYFWGWLTRKHSPYLLATISQGIAIVIFLVFSRMEPGPWLVVVTVLLGVSWGSSLFPVIATAAKAARGLNPTERAGWMVGGSWGFAGIFQMLFGVATDWGVALTTIVQLPVVFIFLGMMLSFVMWRKVVSSS